MWRETLEFLNEDDEIVIRQKKRVDRAIKRAEKALRGEGIELFDGPGKDETLLECFPYVGKAIDRATMDLAYDCKDKNDWNTFERIILPNSFAMQITFDYLLNVIPEDRMYNLTVSAYTWGGAKKKGVRAAVKKLPEYGKPDLPEDFEDVITVYRGCVGSTEKAAASFSWTTNLEVAKYFRRAQENYYCDKAHIYSGKIRKEDIAAYITELGQFEVVQLGKVYDLEEITDQVYDDKYELQQ